MQVKVPYFVRKNMPRRTFVTNEEKQALGFKAGRNRLTVLFYESVVWFMNRTALIYKATPEPWREKINISS